MLHCSKLPPHVHVHEWHIGTLAHSITPPHVSSSLFSFQSKARRNPMPRTTKIKNHAHLQRNISVHTFVPVSQVTYKYNTIQYSMTGGFYKVCE